MPTIELKKRTYEELEEEIAKLILDKILLQDKINKAIDKLKYYKAKPYSEYDSDDIIVDLDWILKGE